MTEQTQPKQQGLPEDLLARAILTTFLQKEPLGTVKVKRKGSQIILPEGMSEREAIKWLKRKIEEDEREIGIEEQVDAHPYDGAIAFAKALGKIYGWVGLQPTPGFFGSTPPKMIGVKTSPTETVQVPWGRIGIPNIDGFLACSYALKEGRLIFCIRGEVKQRHKSEVAEIARVTREIIQKESIYRGKAIKVHFPPEDAEPDISKCPEFLDLSNIHEEELIFPREVSEVVKTSLFNPIEHTDLCRKHKIPLKRGILLEGPFGCGKTLTANVAAKKCEENGWTFIYLENVDQLAQAVNLAKCYEPCMIFAEDLDQVISGDRDSNVNSILNIIDGIDAKGTEVIIVLTTNFVEKIDKAMLRPGRLDAVISIKEPDAEAASKLIRLYGRNRIDEHEDLSQIGEYLEGRTPAILREVVERAKLAAISRLESGDDMRITEEDLLVAARGMTNHLELTQAKEKDKRNPKQKIADSFQETCEFIKNNGLNVNLNQGEPQE